ncbi:signal recognition particle-docking protein FtsY [Myceligenerans pegani]|uniref:Signal recognition particle receptor FtsY n=1 Tax=Myceligenerans pegani TaxID=2776917 RepID=A0ABR9MXW9_9MICO|nr:signal recognition particle-docking protein FtsY [Myceligenerans sp. TRM 65318]MBE1876238.1 signal recognition particle-docking protein FtsY [Myceligenerans sp. TRM 65318]MBE3018509.1 signal recognition particle-docking protein FtsY [Myceligenerans sp. TRM 65318]
MNEVPWIEIIVGLVVAASGGGLIAFLRARAKGSGDAGGADTIERPGQVDEVTSETEEAGGPASGTVVIHEPGTGTIAEEAPSEPAAEKPAVARPVVEKPAPVAGRLVRLRDRLARSGSPLGARLLEVLSRDSLTEDDWDELEEELLLADIGAGPTAELLDSLRTRVRVLGVREPAAVRELLREELVALVGPDMDRSLHVEPSAGEEGTRLPAVVLVVGVNGTGKTTTVGKLARVLVAEDRSVVLGAADTFRAAAADQLTTWGARVGVGTVRSDKEGADPASVAFDAVTRGRDEKADVVLVDTAGRLQNKAGLMDELGKIVRVTSKVAAPSEVLLVLDATTGQNGLTQARVFAEVAGVTGIVLTKLDGTAKGGIVVQVQRELGVPVKLVGLGEGPDDLAPFDAAEFVDGILG